MDVLDTERLTIQPFVMDDLEAANQLLDVELQWAGPGISLEERRARLQREISLAAWQDTGCLYGYRAILLKPGQILIGICGFLPSLWSPHQQALFWPQLFHHPPDRRYNYASPELEIGYALSPHYRGQGYATAAVRALVDYAFRELWVQRLFATTNRKNTGSINLMKRIGMRVASNPEHPELDWPDGPGVAGVIENKES